MVLKFHGKFLGHLNWCSRKFDKELIFKWSFFWLKLNASPSFHHLNAS